MKVIEMFFYHGSPLEGVVMYHNTNFIDRLSKELGFIICPVAPHKIVFLQDISIRS